MKNFIVVVTVMIGLVACGQDKQAPVSPSIKSTKVQQAPAGEKKKGLDAFLSGGPRSTKVVKPEDVKK